mmetsp:Transcript_37894/g.27895  ORF Transcript_37894/g.27895 Transcript_37894/m.27895 type:complete len:115 (+) Transcript_37894:408-752(+)
MLLVAGATAILCPLTAPSIYPWYFLVRMVGGCAIFGIMGNPMIVDYIKKESRGKAYAIQSLAVMVGSYVGIGILFNATKGLPVDIAQYICGAFVVPVALTLAFIMKEPVIKVKV